MKTLKEMSEKDSRYKALSSALEGTGMSDEFINKNIKKSQKYTKK